MEPMITPSGEPRIEFECSGRPMMADGLPGYTGHVDELILELKLTTGPTGQLQSMSGSLGDFPYGFVTNLDWVDGALIATGAGLGAAQRAAAPIEPAIRCGTPIAQMLLRWAAGDGTEIVPGPGMDPHYADRLNRSVWIHQTYTVVGADPVRDAARHRGTFTPTSLVVMAAVHERGGQTEVVTKSEARDEKGTRSAAWFGGSDGYGHIDSDHPIPAWVIAQDKAESLRAQAVFDSGVGVA